MAEGGSSCGDFLAQYRTINNKLKKRFLRKPNVTEASEQFARLALQCERDDIPQYAGMCWSASARCENSLGNTSGEAWNLLRAGRQYLKAETIAYSLGCPSPGGEHVQAAMSSYSQAEARWQQQHIQDQPLSGNQNSQSSLAAGIVLELGQALRVDLGRVAEAATQFRHAAELQQNCPLQRLHSLGLLATCQIELGDYDDALNVFNQMFSIAERCGDSPMGVYRDFMHRCEITRVLLLLILQPTPRRLAAAPELAKVLEKYAWAEDRNVPVCYLTEDQFLLLQSLVMACQSQDIKSLCSLEADLWCHLSAEQKDLLRTLVKQMSDGTK
ncbi:Factor VIII intron 22 protein [Blattella germanica]|nr:Factor VIII intron 22 protein [Blattella germanica]